MAYPGSKLYKIAIKEGWELPNEWHGFSQHSYETFPLPTKHLTSKEVLMFRDDAFYQYFKAQTYLDMIERKLGRKIQEHIRRMTEVRLKRRLLES